MNKYKKILVTGGCGFIGSHFIRLILEEPEVEVLNLDVLTYAGNPDNLVDIVATKADRYRHLKVNICDSELIKKYINEFSPDVVFILQQKVTLTVRTLMHLILFALI